jgi:protein-S-isoprenylcysteine O-methyltransferase Ste14
MPDNEKDVPGVIVFPPLIPLTVLVVGAFLDWRFPLAIISYLPLGLRILLGVALFATGIGMARAAERAMKRVGTNVNPFRPALAIAQESIFRRVRNPMYVGMGLALLGIIVGFGLEWTFVLFVVSFVVLHYGVVLREERYLERKFGDSYRAYKASVPRYGLKLR